ncbi:MAG: 50S ribosomal protein L22 [Candidatus Micrarchaeota archaeon]|nr:50S ribosomal protein L22 [Candidatus Micrarchaeota archaeon]
MMQMYYSFQKKGENYAYAQQYNLDASYKDLCEVCKSIKHKPVAKAMELLSKAEKMEVPILYTSHNKKLGHRRELGGKKGRYPVKAVRIVKKVLQNAINNAKVCQLEEDTLSVVHAAANKQSIYPRLSPKGRRMRMNYETARVEIVVRGTKKKIAEISPAAKPAKKGEAAAQQAKAPAESTAKESAAPSVKGGAEAASGKEAKQKAERPRKDATSKLTKTKKE